MSQLSQSDVAVSVHDAQPSDHPGIRAVLLAAYQEYAAVLPPASSTVTWRTSSTSAHAPASGGSSSPNAPAGSLGR